MDLASFARAVFALAITIGLIGLAGVAMRRFGPEAMARFASTRAERRLAVVETLVLDPSRRLLIVSCDGEERLLLLGEGQVLNPPSTISPPAAARPTAPRKARKPKAQA
ncbi:flagellar biosynthetic protein FliO [Phenylobacterium sp.]|uniref:flagellar biosynthetic protein FliO n=1 Tax=Phenylobacterium sp. TaxID=1871053 RepID=UPI00272F6C44|nr:flagellar biosynthetic protein FliO [Phenylobacterium sp.]MDP1875330.1 flagellar biosynthetic protein FliO [Phenylobacterium sp.]MDP3491245.1 flagellar biosynthetic protein FliO [Phenylobacterium sp.]